MIITITIMMFLQRFKYTDHYYIANISPYVCMVTTILTKFINCS